jgi:RNA polymerase sigma-70 factor (ECF subfamily)
MSLTKPRFEALIDEYHDELYRYLYRLSASYRSVDPEREAEDLTQETFMRAYRAYGRLRPDSNPRAWLYKIATNRAHSALARGSRRPEAEAKAGAVPPAPQARALEQGVIRRQRLDDLQAAIASLPFKQRSALTLRHLQGLPYDDVGAAIGCSVESARANVYQAMQRLRRLLPEEDGS